MAHFRITTTCPKMAGLFLAIHFASTRRISYQKEYFKGLFVKNDQKWPFEKKDGM